jgi:hypothetical protein
MSRQRTLKCVEHGKVAWRGDVVCDVCKTIFLCTEKENGRVSYELVSDDGTCSTCGARLFPEPGKKDSDFSARPVCERCARPPHLLVTAHE